MTQVRVRRVDAIGALALAGTVALVVAGCTGGTTPSAVASAVANASFPPVPTEAASPSSVVAPSTAATDEPSASALPSAVATDIDPCQLITAEEAGALVGVTFGAGKEEENANHVKMCSYAAPGPNIFSVEVAIAPDVATAKAAEAAQEQDLKDSAQQLAKLGMTVTKLPNFAPDTDAALLQGSLKEGPLAVAGRAMFLLRGTTFVAFSDVAVNGQPPSEQAMKDKAMELLGKLP